MNFKNVLINAIVYFFIFIGTAHAYLDPGTGSIIISTIIAFFVAAWNYIKIYYFKIKNYFKKPLDKNKDSQ